MEGEQVHVSLLVEILTPVGAASFEWVEQTNGYPVGWHLCFVWIADAFRRQGLLLKRWPHWVTQYGLFTIERPISDSFQSFLRKVDYAGLEEELEVRLKEYIEKKEEGG